MRLYRKIFSIAGLFAAAFDFGIEWLVVKGIADFADGKGSSTASWEPFASGMAASVVFNFLSDANVFSEWPHYQGNDNLIFTLCYFLLMSCPFSKQVLSQTF